MLTEAHEENSFNMNFSNQIWVDLQIRLNKFGGGINAFLVIPSFL
jgi:hypothetical protein